MKNLSNVSEKRLNIKEVRDWRLVGLDLRSFKNFVSLFKFFHRQAIFLLISILQPLITKQTFRLYL